MKKKIYNSRQIKKSLVSFGFTLVETLVAIAILSLAMTGPLVIAEKGLSSSVYAQDQVIATYLAQDAIEYVRNVRDTNRINYGSASANWLLPFSSTCMAAGEHCQIDTAKATVALCSGNGGVCPVMNFDNSNLWYTYDSTNGNTIVPTIFTRTVDLSYVPNNNNNEVIVTAKVSWQTNIFTQPQSVVVSEHIFNL